MARISKLQTTYPKDFSGMVLKDSLQALGQSPDFNLDNMITTLYKADYQIGVADYLKSIGKTRIVPRDKDGWYSWRLQGSSMKTIPIVRATTLAGVEFTSASIGALGAGYGKQPFFITFGEKYFQDVQMIVGEKGSKYKLIIQDEPQQIGTEWRYEVKLAGPNASLFMPYEQLVSGKHFSVDGSPVESTLSKKGSGFNYTSSFEMRNTYSMARFQETVPTNMQQRPVKWTIQTNEGKKFSIWDDYMSWERRKQMKLYTDRLINYGTINADDNGRILDKGKSGFTLRMGSGIEEQMESGNKYLYSKFSIEFLESAIMDLSDNTKGYAQKSNVLVKTGKYGATLAHTMIQAKATAFTPLQSDKFISKGAYGGQKFDPNFTSYVTPNGQTITFMVDPMFDDLSDARSQIQMSDMTPGLPGPALSYTYQVLNVGVEGGDNNLELIYIETSETIYGYKPGPRTKIGMMAKADPKYGHAYAMNTDGCEYSYMTPEFSVVLRDPTRTLVMKPAILE